MENSNSIDTIDKIEKTTKKHLVNKSYYEKNKNEILQKRKEQRMKLKEETKEQKIKEKQIKKVNNIFNSLQLENPELFNEVLRKYIDYDLILNMINENEELANKLKNELSDESSNESSDEEYQNLDNNQQSNIECK